MFYLLGCPERECSGSRKLGRNFFLSSMLFFEDNLINPISVHSICVLIFFKYIFLLPISFYTYEMEQNYPSDHPLYHAARKALLEEKVKTKFNKHVRSRPNVVGIFY